VETDSLADPLVMVKFYVQRPSPGPIVAVTKKVLGRSPCGAEARKRERRTDGFAHENAPQWVPASNERCGFPRGPGQNDPEMVANIEIFFQRRGKSYFSMAPFPSSMLPF
jgi:hypothetical protein